MIKNIKEIIAIAIAAAFILFCSINAAGCTSAIIGAEANPSGRPILWKHRDTSAIDNKVEYIAFGSRIRLCGALQCCRQGPEGGVDRNE